MIAGPEYELMSDVAVRVEDLGKLYRIGAAETYATFRESLMQFLTAPFRRPGKLNGGNGYDAETTDRIWALSDVSFEIEPGEVVGIIGRNGAGKSTLLKILSRITEPTRGFAEIHGRVGSLLEVGTGFHGELSGRENIYLNGAILGMKKSEIERKFDEIVAFAEVEKFIDTPVKRYSSGMYLRLAFAVAAHLEPDILIVDEVLAVGDASFQKKCLGKMEDVAKQGRTVLFVSHNMAAVAQLCEKVVWLENGRSHKIGLAEDVVKEYMTDDNEQIAERRWTHPGDAPGDDRVRLLAVRAVQNELVTSVIDINEPSQIEIEFAVLQDVRNLLTGIEVINSMGISLFGNCDWRPNKLTAGRYRKHVAIPGQLLAEGRVEVILHIAFYDPESTSVLLPRAVAVEAIESDHPLAVRGLYRGPWAGVLRVALPWSDAVKTA
jgi:homopolymeric O-antigen transport system ATP-binding protein